LTVGQEGIFFLQADFTNAFCRQIEYALPIGKLDLHFENAKKAALAVVKVYADPNTALLADTARDRQFAAVALVARYRAGRPAFGTQTFVNEPISADQSKLIVEVLSEMKWNDPPLDPEGVMSLSTAFWQLQLTEKDGWLQPRPQANEDPNEVMSKAVAKWFKEHSATYRIQRLVVGASGAKYIKGF
jgi:hypothetical protein